MKTLMPLRSKVSNQSLYLSTTTPSLSLSVTLNIFSLPPCLSLSLSFTQNAVSFLPFRFLVHSHHTLSSHCLSLLIPTLFYLLKFFLSFTDNTLYFPTPFVLLFFTLDTLFSPLSLILTLSSNLLSPSSLSPSLSKNPFLPCLCHSFTLIALSFSPFSLFL